MSAAWVPTVEDLRVKLCYICREEEHHDNPQQPLVPWVHPCNCTLVAHETCLLTWIQSSQQDAWRSGNALKCPQCGAIYQLESDNPLPLRLLNKISSGLSLVGKFVGIAGIAGVVVSFGFGVYILLTSYGAYAVKEFIGSEMYSHLLTDDPSNWPWHAYFNLPLVPLSLVIARTRLLDSFPLVPLFLAWSSSPPVSSPESLVTSPWRYTLSPEDYPFVPLISWPPSPIMATVLFPFVSQTYHRQFSRFRHWVMGTEPGSETPIRRLVWRLNENGDGALRVQIGANIEPAQGQGQRQQRQEQQAQAAPREDGAEEEGEDQQNDPAAAAEQTLRVTGASLGRFVGGALLVPAIASRMGSLLLRLSRHSLLLRRILAARPPMKDPPMFGRWFDNQQWTRTGYVRHLGMGMQVVVNLICGGTRIWTEADPVWWRNSLGLGVFVVAKDCINLLHLWLTKREIETRRIKSIPFAGVDINELDLIDRAPT